MKYVMVDLETMSTANNAAILSIGAVKFTANEILEKFYVNVDLEDCERYGLHISGSTIKWWMSPSKDGARKSLTEKPESLCIALEMLADFYGDNECSGIWGNASTFDITILESAYRATGRKTPWSYKGHRCYRTMVAMFGQRVRAPEQSGTHHNALDDAVYQTVYLQRILQLLSPAHDGNAAGSKPAEPGSIPGGDIHHVEMGPT